MDKRNNDSETEQEETESSSEGYSSSGKGSRVRFLPAYALLQAKTASFDKLVSDEVTIAKAMMTMNPLHSLSDQQRERVMRIKGGIKAGPSSEGECSGRPQIDSEKLIEQFGFGGWSNALPCDVHLQGPRCPPGKAPLGTSSMALPKSTKFSLRGGNTTPGKGPRADKLQAVTVSSTEDGGFELSGKNSKQGENVAMNGPHQARMSNTGKKSKERGAEDKRVPLHGNLSLQHDQAAKSLANTRQRATEPLLAHSYLQAFQKKDKGSLSDTDSYFASKKSGAMDQSAPLAEPMVVEHISDSSPETEMPPAVTNSRHDRSGSKEERSLKLPPLQILPPQTTQTHPLKRFPTINKWVLRPEFASTARSDQHLHTHPWTPLGGLHMEENGIHYPQLFRSHTEKMLSWNTVLKDAGQLDGYRKIHADRKKMKEDIKMDRRKSHDTGYLGRHLEKSSSRQRGGLFQATSPLPDFSTGTKDPSLEPLHDPHDRQEWTANSQYNSPKHVQTQLNSIKLQLNADLEPQSRVSNRNDSLTSHCRRNSLLSENRHQHRLKSGEWL